MVNTLCAWSGFVLQVFTVKMEWEKEKILAFIEAYKLKTNLWKSKYYKDRNMRHDALMEIANEFNIEKQVVEQKIKNFQSQLARKVKKIKDSNKSRNGIQDVYKSKWFAYESFKIKIYDVGFRSMYNLNISIVYFL